jgi:hypothetical protein
MGVVYRAEDLRLDLAEVKVKLSASENNYRPVPRHQTFRACQSGESTLDAER